VFDAFGAAGHLLLGRRDLCGRDRIRARRKGFGVGGSDLVSPAAVMLDDLVGDPAHVSLRAYPAPERQIATMVPREAMACHVAVSSRSDGGSRFPTGAAG